MEEIQGLSDRDLADELRKYGVNPGPIIASTRSVYEKKLWKLKSGVGTAGKSRPHIKYTEVPDDEEKSPPPKARSPKLRKRVVKKAEPEPEEPDEMDTSGAFDLPDADDSETSMTDSDPAAKSSGGMGMLVKVIILLVVLFFAYLVYINMEPSSGNKVPKIKQD